MKLLTVIISVVMLVSAGFAQRSPITIYLAGDSTCADKLPEKRPETGWGEMLDKHFQDGKVKIENRAMNGRSTKTFISEGRWQKIVDEVKKGDWVFVQFGHNDSSKDKGERYTPPDAYRANLIRFIGDVQAKKANIVLMTPVVRRRFDKEGMYYDTHGEYPGIVRVLAKEYSVPLIDMQQKSEAMLKTLGAEPSRSLFLQLKPGENPNYPKGVDDNTHFNPKGAEEMAKLAVEGIREAKLKLKKYLKK